MAKPFLPLCPFSCCLRCLFSFWKAAACLRTSAAQGTAVLQTWRHIQNATGKIHCVLDRAVFCHPASRLHGATPWEILSKTTGLFAEQGTIQNERTWQNSSNYLLFINTWEPLRNRKFSEMHTPSMNTHREGAHAPPWRTRPFLPLQYP